MSIQPWVIAAIFAIVLAIAGRSINGAFGKMIAYFFSFLLGVNALIMASTDWLFWLIIVSGGAAYLAVCLLKARAKKRKEHEKERSGGNANTNNFFFGGTTPPRR